MKIFVVEEKLQGGWFPSVESNGTEVAAYVDKDEAKDCAEVTADIRGVKTRVVVYEGIDRGKKK
jgi:hypothetical protein